MRIFSALHSATCAVIVTHIQLDDPEQGDEEQVEGHEEAEGAAHVGDGFLLSGGQVVGRRVGERGLRVGGVQGGDGREAPHELAAFHSARHACSADRGTHATGCGGRTKKNRELLQFQGRQKNCGSGS